MKLPSLDDLAFDQSVFASDMASSDGNGTRNFPWRAPAGNLDHIFAKLAPSCHLTLFPGHYFTNGFKVPPRFRLSGPAKISLYTDSGKLLGFPHCRMFTDRNWSNVLILEDLVLDGNFQNQSQASAHGNFKIELLYAKTTRARLQRVRISNFGVNSRDYKPSEKLEAFPLSLKSYASGPPTAAYLSNLAHFANDPWDFTQLEIIDCEVERGHFIDGGYCTAIFVETSDPGNRLPFGARNTPAAIIRNNTIRGLKGIAYGCANSESVIFEGNSSLDCKSAINIDYGEIRNIVITRNQFIRCNHGLNITPQPTSRGLTLTHNTISVREPFWNPITREFEPHYFCNIDRKNLADITERDNYLVYDPTSRPVPGLSQGAFISTAA